MKRLKLLSAVLLAAMLVGSGAAFAASPYATTVSTVIPNGSVNGAAAFTAAGYPNISGGVKIRKLWFTNDGATEVVNVWKTCTSSTVATLVWTGIVASSNTANQDGVLNMDSLPDTFNVQSPCISKGLNGSGTVKVHVQYQ